MWTSIAKDHYIIVYFHYILDFQLFSKIIKVTAFDNIHVDNDVLKEYFEELLISTFVFKLLQLLLKEDFQQWVIL